MSKFKLCFVFVLLSAMGAYAATATVIGVKYINAGQTKKFGNVTVTVDDGKVSYTKSRGKLEIRVQEPSNVTIKDDDPEDDPDKTVVTVNITSNPEGNDPNGNSEPDPGESSTVNLSGDGNTVNNAGSGNQVNVDGDGNHVEVTGDGNGSHLGGDSDGSGSDNNTGHYGQNANGNSISSNNSTGSGNSWSDFGGNSYSW